MDVASIKMSRAMWATVKAVAALETMRTGKNVSASELVRKAINEVILKPNSGLIGIASRGMK